MARGVPYQHPVMGVLISRAVPRGTSLCFTAEQDNNRSPSPSLSYRGTVFLAGVSPGPCWGCKPGSEATDLLSHTRVMARLEEPLEAVQGTGSWQPT